MKNMKMAFCLLFLGLAAPMNQTVSAGLINFDDYPLGTLTFAAADRYQSLGVLFSREIPIYSVAYVEADWWVAMLQAGGGTLPNVLPLSTTVDPRISIEMSFVVPGTSTPATTDYFRCQFFDTEIGSTMGILDAFDSSGNLLASTTPTTPSSCTAILELNVSGIARVRFSDTGDGVEIDNISFHTPVPEPATLLLLGLGGLLLRRR